MYELNHDCLLKTDGCGLESDAAMNSHSKRSVASGLSKQSSPLDSQILLDKIELILEFSISKPN